MQKLKSTKPTSESQLAANFNYITNMNLQEHNNAELGDIQTIFLNEKWHVGVALGRDPEGSLKDLETVWNRVTEVLIEGGQGEKLARKLHGGKDPAHEA